MIKRFIIAIILLGLVGGGLVGFNLFRDRMIADFFANMPVQPLTVSTVEAEGQTWQPALTAIGTVNAIQGVDLTVEAAGVVQEILFESNSRVEAGQMLLRLDDRVQTADVEAARTQQDLDRVNLTRARELQGRGVATSSSLDAAEAAAQASEAQLARATALMEQRQLSAPFGGTIGLPRVDLGQYISPGTVVATLQDLDMMRVDFSLPEQNLPVLSLGQPLHVRFEDQGAVFDGEITGINPRVDPASRMVALRGTIRNSGDDVSLTPGQFVRVQIDLPVEENIIALPHTAVVNSLYGDYAYVVRPRENDPEQLEARQVFVQLGRRSGDRVEVREGISPGDTIVSAGQNRLSNGAPVVIDNTVNPMVRAEALTE
ncbi:efflux RND transporter periplasmic adaptor subunit [Halodurantibacterium flavum]|uniref:Efflux RND transporter periplasmic adaptor subunit n=1 Tax=Halodurantibacterium flavum TaxID=1382802 RepID=A0ABW4S6L1_9RHOB